MVAKLVNKKNAGKPRVLAFYALLQSLAALIVVKNRRSPETRYVRNFRYKEKTSPKGRIRRLSLKISVYILIYNLKSVTAKEQGLHRFRWNQVKFGVDDDVVEV